jgi:uncharacterized protein YecE (DUF72 family)
MERQLLSVGSRGGEDAAVLRRAVSDGRDQLHVLPHADREARRRLGGADAVADSVARFCEVAATLGDKLGALLFQLPPFLRKDLALLDGFLPQLPSGIRGAFEFRHVSWLDEEVFGRLAAKNLAVCIADSEKLSTPVRVTADYAYFRLRDEGYQPNDIKRWADTIAASTSSCRDVFVYFKHEESGKGPEFARLLMDHLGI